MSKYTTEVRFICETEAELVESTGYSQVSEVINNSWRKVFSFDFPIFDESYRAVLCKKILMHYYTREIGLESYGLWKLKLETKLNEIMPYYNKIYLTTVYDINPMYDVDYYKSHSGEDASNTSVERTGSTSNTEEGTGSVDSTHKFSDTPQGGLVGLEGDTYLTNASIDNQDNEYERTYTGSSTDNTGTDYSSTNEYLEHVFGKTPGRSYAKMIKEYRDVIINIDMQIIDELSELFMKVW